MYAADQKYLVFDRGITKKPKRNTSKKFAQPTHAPRKCKYIKFIM